VPTGPADPAAAPPDLDGASRDRDAAPTAGPRPALPADPEAYDSPRAAQARARGLAAPYIAGGTDPDAEATARQERLYLKILVAMVVVIVLSGWVLGIIAKLLGY
jgi:hypothetical protein